MIIKKIQAGALVAIVFSSQLICGPAFGGVSPGKITFDSLFANRKSVSYVAWQQFAKSFDSGPVEKVHYEILVGPHTKMLYKTPEKAIDVVNRAFHNHKTAKNVVFIEYQYADMDWAYKQLSKLVDAAQMQIFNRNENGGLVSSNCMDGTKNCGAAKALTAANGVAFVLEGVSNEAPFAANVAMNVTSGMLEAHEYFHSIQDVPFRGKMIAESNYPPQWFTEGSAEVVKNLVINHAAIKKYKAYVGFMSAHLYGDYINRDPAYISKYLDFSNNKNKWENYSKDDAYLLGNRICEILVAVGGLDSLMTMNEEMGKNIGFLRAFNNVYGISWSKAQPLIAKTIAANIADNL